MHEDALKELRKADRVLGRVINRIGPCTLIPEEREPYAALVRSVVFQQLNGTAAEKILGRVRALYPHAEFPTPHDLLRTEDASLRAAGLSGAKVAAVKSIATHVENGVVPDLKTARKLSDDELVERLTVIRGVGPWTVQMFLMFTLGRPDVLPTGDFGVRKGFSVAYKREAMPTPQELLAHGERWRPFRSVASWYLWRVLD